MEQKLSLSELNEHIKTAIEGAFPTSVWVVAEISELKENRNGHCYLELVEKQGAEIVARSRATIWSYTYRMLKPYFETSTGQIFDQGIKILVQVSVEYHQTFGLSVNIKDIDPIYTVGDMALQRRQIINRLKSEGIFEMNKELELPLVPQKIAVISSATAAGYLDFMNHLQTNAFGFKFYVKLFQATMQGTETAPSVIHALERIFQYEDFFEAVVIIRGGGATADLSSFDNYDLAYYITQFPLPVITGIGHEKDDTIIDLVAHTRLKTPTAVAEFLISGMSAFYDSLQETEAEIVRLAREIIETRQTELEQAVTNLNFSVTSLISGKQAQLAKKGNQLQRGVHSFAFKKEHHIESRKHLLKSSVLLWFARSKSRIEKSRVSVKHAVVDVLLKKNGGIVHFKDILTLVAQKRILRERERLHLNENTARLINPENVLKRGYTLTLAEGKIVKSAKELLLQHEIETRFADGKVKSRIIKDKEDDN